MDAYSLDLRTRVLAACDAGKKTKQVAEQFSVSPAWVRRLKQRRRERAASDSRRKAEARCIAAGQAQRLRAAEAGRHAGGTASASGRGAAGADQHRRLVGDAAADELHF